MSNVAAEELKTIGQRHGSDKFGLVRPCHEYAEPYAKHFTPKREAALTLLEIGVGGYDIPGNGGESLRTWKEYFPNGSIVGLDFFDKKTHEEERIKIYRGSQADPTIVGRIAQEHPRGFDIIIDDGSHRGEHIVSTFYMLWQYLCDGGYYVIEDVQTAYWPNHGGHPFSPSDPLSAMGFAKILIDGLNWEERHIPTYRPSVFDCTITGISFYHNLIFFEKGDNGRGSTGVAGNRIPGF